MAHIDSSTRTTVNGGVAISYVTRCEGIYSNTPLLFWHNNHTITKQPSHSRLTTISQPSQQPSHRENGGAEEGGLVGLDQGVSRNVPVRRQRRQRQKQDGHGWRDILTEEQSKNPDVFVFSYSVCCTRHYPFLFARKACL